MMGYENHAPTFNTLEFWDGLQGHNCNDKGLSSMAELRNIIGGNKDFPTMCFRISRSLTFQKCRMKFLIF